MKIIENWRQCWKMFSQQANAIGIALCSTYALMYEQLKETIPPQYMTMITLAVFAAGFIGRMIDQPKAK